MIWKSTTFNDDSEKGVSPVMEAAGAVTAMPALGSTTAKALSARLYRAQKLAAQ